MKKIEMPRARVALGRGPAEQRLRRLEPAARAL